MTSSSVHIKPPLISLVSAQNPSNYHQSLVITCPTMPFFRSATPPPERKGSIFSRNSQKSSSDSGSPTRKGSFFSGHRRSSSNSNGSGSHGNVLSRFKEEDASILAARERVSSAEAAEREADKALEAAKRMVRDARDEVKKLEREVAEEARRAKEKQATSKTISKTARKLGRHDNH